MKPGAPALAPQHLSAQTVLHHRILSGALAQAVKWRLLAQNPCASVDPRKPEEREQFALDEHQAALLLREAEGDRLFVPVLLAITTRMRLGRCGLL